jgi:hypothetical protein
MLYTLAQYLIKFPISRIEQFVLLDEKLKKLGKTSEEREFSLAELKLFQELCLDKLLKELYSRINPLFYEKNLQNLLKMRLREVILYSTKADQMLFHYSFGYVIHL